MTGQHETMKIRGERVSIFRSPCGTRHDVTSVVSRNETYS